MATYLPTSSAETNDATFLQLIEEARINIQQMFRDLMEKLQLREATLLKQLEDIKSDYELNSLETQRELNALKAQRDFTAQNLKLNKFKQLQQQQVEQLNQMISKLEMEDGEERRISWSWDSQLIEAISAVGELEVITGVRTLAIDYKQKVIPVITKCRDGSNDGDLEDPWGVAVDMNIGNIYITDNDKHCVKVYTSNGEFLFKFGDDKKLIYPRNICIHKEKLYLSHNHGVMIFNINGHFLHKLGGFERGSNKNQFNSPYGIAISPLNSDIYICDCMNDRVQIYDSKKIKYKSTFGISSLKCPSDIKFAQNELYILAEQDPCLHVYTTEHVYIRSIISKGSEKQIDFPFCFHIDNNCNILITDYRRHCLYIFTNRGELLHQIGGGKSSDMHEPKGVTIDKDGRIIIVNYKSTAELLIF